jgi:Asp-tRNA(Asn)/Glu-tRNA(Gln) amidotransferase A subunit family amidase
VSEGVHEDVRFVSAAEPVREVRGWELPPIEVVGAFLERIEDRNQEIDAYVTTPGDGVREAAVSAERAL